MLLFSFFVVIIVICIFTGLTLTQTVSAAPQNLRPYGVNRYETAIAIFNNGWKDGSEYAVLTTGENYPDALSAAPLAKKYNAPILLTTKII